MKVIELFLHFFTPRHTNNHKAKALHPFVITFYIAGFLFLQIGISIATRNFPQVLGYATNVKIEDLLKFSNEQRLQNGVSVLSLNNQLSIAAQAKGEDMFSGQYWAHTSPTGRDPWKFITAAGYNYLYAGENLARDFADSQSAVSAWMNSPSHKENLLNTRYQEVGFAIVNGKYGDYETTVIVQMLGTKQNLGASVDTKPIPAARSNIAKTASISAETKNRESTISAGTVTAYNNKSVLPVSANLNLDAFSLTKKISLLFVLILILVLAIDAILVYRRKIIRISGHNLAHIMLLVLLYIVLNLIGKGAIL